MPIAVFTGSIFLSALLLFTIQPMFAKMVLPVLGGAPQVWNTCMVFFQACLLAGYAYAHFSLRYLGRYQIIIHLGLMSAVFLYLPLSFSSAAAPGESEFPALWLLWHLLVSIGLPFFLLSSTTPLLQRWYSTFNTSGARDPYFLYAASNLGSLLALLSYPFFIELNSGLVQQLNGWSWCYAILYLCLFICAILTFKQAYTFKDRPADTSPATAIGWKRSARWVSLAFVPSSMMLGLTSFVTGDLAAAPLIWVLPWQFTCFHSLSLSPA